MLATLLGSADYRRMPWKNGLGVTTEIARSPREGDFEWRVSTADVTTDGPFSPFPGCDRVILTLEGTGMLLSHREPHVDVVLGPLEPWAFSGDWTTTCALRSGPIRDFNLIARRDLWSSRLAVLGVDAATMFETQATLAILYCAEGSVTVDTGTPCGLERDETLTIELAAPARIAIAPSTLGAVVIAVELARR